MVVEAGQTLEIEIEEEQSNEWTGPQGVTKIDGVEIRINNAKKGDKFKIQIVGVETNQWTNARQARFTVL